MPNWRLVAWHSPVCKGGCACYQPPGSVYYPTQLYNSKEQAELASRRSTLSKCVVFWIVSDE